MSAFVLNRNYQLQLPNSYVDVDREEMEYVDGGFSIPRYIFTTTINVGVTAAITAISGGVGTAGLRIVLGSMSLKRKFAAAIVKAIGKVSITAANAIGTSWVNKICAAMAMDLGGWVFDSFIDGIDGSRNGSLKLW